MVQMKFIPGGRYLYYAGRKAKFINNCFVFKGEEDTREEWARLLHDHTSALMTGGGIGTDYSIFRGRGHSLSRTGGLSSGPLALMHASNEIGRNVRQGGSRRSAIYASLNWRHHDIDEFLHAKDWASMPIHEGYSVWDAKADNFDFPAPLDMTNISVNYDDAWLNHSERHLHPVFLANVRQALQWGDPGFSFNFGANQDETGRNACAEITSADDSDVCNLGSVNLGAIDTLDEYAEVVRLASQFLVAGTLRGDLPNKKIESVRDKNRRLGLGNMGFHEWLLKRGHAYRVHEELHEWLKVYAEQSEVAANEFCDRFYLNHPVKYRAIAPNGTTGILAGTTTGIEPLYAVAYKRRYIDANNVRKYEYVIDATAQHLITEHSIDPDSIETAMSLAENPIARMHFQAQVQRYVDHGISSTLNLPPWGTEHNNESKVEEFAKTLSDFAPHLRGFTVYPDGARGGQPLTPVSYSQAKLAEGVVFEENDVCLLTGKGGTCGS